MIGATLSHYRITAKLGAGGMGEVWQATDTQLGREVALKVLPPDFAADPDRHARFEREARVLASLSHPNIAHLYGLETAAVIPNDSDPSRRSHGEPEAEGRAGGSSEALWASRSQDSPEISGDPSTRRPDGRLAQDDIGREAGARLAQDDIGREAGARLAQDDTGEMVGGRLAQDDARRGAGGESERDDRDSGHTSVTFIVMELVEGEGLDQRISRGPIPVEEAAAIATGIAEALEAAHASGIVHRDLKPANVKIRPDGTVKVLDFGLAKAWESEAVQGSLSMSPTITRHATLEGVILGTAAYMSPEQAAGTAADYRSDIWAFGVVMWEMLTGNKLFEGETVSHVLASVLKDQPDIEALPDETPPRLVELVSRCLRKKPRQRLQAVGDARVLLEEYLADPSSFDAVAAPIEQQETQAAPRWRRLLPWVAAAILTIALAASLLIPRTPSVRVLQATIPPPEGTVFNLAPVGPGPAVVSPDGTRLAFSAQDADGAVRLFVRRLDAGEAVVLSGTEGAQYPFWSPDSRWIAFFTRDDSTLKKIDTSGGPPVTICDAANGKGGSWGADGVIVFAPNADTPIHRVSSAGGEAAPITEIDSTRHNSHRHPRFLPDGNHFLYLARGQAEANSAVFAASVDGGEARELLLVPTQAEYVDGLLLFVRERTLMAQPFDPDRLELLGESVPLAEGVLAIPGAAVSIFSASPAGVLAYQSGQAEVATTLEWRSRTGQTDGILGDRAPYDHAVLSPDGRFAVVKIPDPGTGMADLWIYDIERDLRTRFTFDPADDTWPVWSPDGTRVFFASARAGSYAIYSKDVGGSGEAESVFAADTDIFPNGITPDGTALVYMSTGGETKADLWLLPLSAGAEPTALRNTAYSEGVGKVSPDGRWLSYNSDESGQFEVYVTTFPEPGRRWQVSTESGGYAFWSADGTEIVYTEMDGHLMAAAVGSEGDTFRVGQVEPLFEIQPPEAGGAFYSLTPDAQRFLVVPSTVQSADTLLNLIVNWPDFLERRR